MAMNIRSKKLQKKNWNQKLMLEALKEKYTKIFLHLSNRIKTYSLKQSLTSRKILQVISYGTCTIQPTVRLISPKSLPAHKARLASSLKLRLHLLNQNHSHECLSYSSKTLRDFLN